MKMLVSLSAIALILAGSIAFAQDADINDPELKALMPDVQLNLLELANEITRNEAMTPERVTQANEKILNALDRYSPETSTTRRKEIPYGEAVEILEKMRTDSVVGIKALPKYDPDGSTGFCFGKATWAHIDLLRRGVDKRFIKKIFVIGPIGTAQMTWQFHVAITVKTDRGWMVIDRDLRNPLRPRDWVSRYAAASKNKKLMYFVVEPSRLGDGSVGKFSARS